MLAGVGGGMLGNLAVTGWQRQRGPVRMTLQTTLTDEIVGGWLGEYDEGRLSVSNRGHGEIGVIDLSKGTDPIVAGAIDTSLDAVTATVFDGDLVYGVDPDDHRFVVVDASDPTALVEVGAIRNTPTKGGYWDLAARDGLAYLCNRGDIADTAIGSFDIVDVTEPASPEIIGVVEEFIEARDVALVDDIAFVVDQVRGRYDAPGALVAVDIADPERPRMLNWYTSSGLDDARFVEVRDDVVFVCARDENGVVSVDISDPMDMQELDHLTGPDLANSHGITIVGDHLYTTQSAPTKTVAEIDARDPTDLSLVEVFEWDERLSDVVSDGNRIYVSELSGDASMGNLLILGDGLP